MRGLRTLAVVLSGFLCLLVSQRAALAQGVDDATSFSSGEWVFIIAGVALLPFLLVMATSFVKIAVVLAILRSGIGAQGVPPMSVVTGLALILTIVVMAPVGQQMVASAEASLEVFDEALEQPPEEGSGSSVLPSPRTERWERVATASAAAAEPLRVFLTRHAHSNDVALFTRLQSETLEAAPEDLLVLVPAFVISELKEAFQIGFLIFLPFLVLDLVVANILLSMGMIMMSPTAVSLPFKLLLFVLVDGWHLLARGLILSYQGG